jgi:hypothetical protein
MRHKSRRTVEPRRVAKAFAKFSSPFLLLRVMPPFPLLPGQTANPDDYECSYRTNYGNDRGCATYVKCAVYETHRALCPPKPKKAWIRHFYPCKDY